MDYLVVVGVPAFDDAEHERAGVVLNGSEGVEDPEVGDGEDDEGEDDEDVQGGGGSVHRRAEGSSVSLWLLVS